MKGISIMYSQIRHRSFNSRSLRKFSLVLVASAGLLAGRSVLAAEPAAGTDLDALFRNYVESLRADVKSGKVEIYSRVMELNANEAKAFWPIYQEYETELFALGDRRVALIKKFAEGYSKQ